MINPFKIVAKVFVFIGLCIIGFIVYTPLFVYNTLFGDDE